MQDEIPMTYKEVLEVAKDKMENVNEYFPGNGSNTTWTSKGGGENWKRQSGPGKKEFQERTVGSIKEFTRRILKDQKFEGKDFCIEYNTKGENGGHSCKERGCKKAHNCAYVPRGETKACGGKHTKMDHWQKTR